MSDATRCRHCGSSDLEPWWRGAGLDCMTDASYTLYRCRSCGFGMVSPIPTPERTAELYPEAFYRTADGADKPRGALSMALSAFYLATFGERARRVGKPRAGHDRLVDVGCGTGRFLALARDRGWSVTGVEPSGESSQQSHRDLGLDVRYETLDRAGFAPASLDAITMWHVLEHIADPGETLSVARDLLSAEGRIVIAVPNFAGWECRLARDRWGLFDVPRHVSFFTPDTLDEALRRAGFEVERRWHHAVEYDAPIAVQSMLNAVCTEPMFLYKIAKREYGRDALSRPDDYAQNLLRVALFSATLAPTVAAAASLAAAMHRGSTYTVRATRR